MEQRNLSDLDVRDAIATCNFLPRRNHVVVTLNKTSASESGLEISGSDEELLSEWQHVIASGHGAEYNPGDKVMIDLNALTVQRPNPENRMELIEVVNIKPLLLEGIYYTLLSDNMIMGKEHDYGQAEDMSV